MKKSVTTSVTSTRREIIKTLLFGATGLALSARLSRTAWADEQEAPAKSVIQIWMWGGPSHLDTFDPKPAAGRDYCGAFNQAINTNADGIRISSKLPLLAKQADKFSIIRSMTHGINGHETASYISQTGHKPGRLVYPSVGAVVSKFKGIECGYKGLIPPYIVLTQPQGRFSESGFLGHQHKPFSTGGDPNKTPFAVEGIVGKGVSDQRQHDRRSLLNSLDTLGMAMPGNLDLKAFNRSEKKAYDMMFGGARKIFDLSQEKNDVRDHYGRNTFGQSCLMARRLVQQGVPYITINYKGWDTHKQHFDIMNRKLPELDQGMSALLQDLSDHGLLSSTVVWWGGEFGRTPKVQWNPPWNGGRGHYGKCYTSVLAGGGLKGGRVVGASSAKGEEVRDRPVSPQDLIGTIYQQLGINPEGDLPNPRGLKVKLLEKENDSKEKLTLLKELL